MRKFRHILSVSSNCFALLRIQRFRGNACHSANSADYFVEVACKTQNRCHIKDSFKTDGRNASCGMRSRRMPRTSLVSWTSDAWSASDTRRHPVHPDACLFLSADFNPDDDDNHNDCYQNGHWSSPPCPQRAARLRPATHTAFCRQRS